MTNKRGESCAKGWARAPMSIFNALLSFLALLLPMYASRPVLFTDRKCEATVYREMSVINVGQSPHAT